MLRCITSLALVITAITGERICSARTVRISSVLQDAFPVRDRGSVFRGVNFLAVATMVMRACSYSFVDVIACFDILAVLCYIHGILFLPVLTNAGFQVLSTQPTGNIPVAINCSGAIEFTCQVEGGEPIWQIATHTIDEDEFHDHGICHQYNWNVFYSVHK